jgi:hypothetical protein
VHAGSQKRPAEHPGTDASNKRRSTSQDGAANTPPGQPCSAEQQDGHLPSHTHVQAAADACKDKLQACKTACDSAAGLSRHAAAAQELYLQKEQEAAGNHAAGEEAKADAELARHSAGAQAVRARTMAGKAQKAADAAKSKAHKAVIDFSSAVEALSKDRDEAAQQRSEVTTLLEKAQAECGTAQEKREMCQTSLEEACKEERAWLAHRDQLQRKEQELDAKVGSYAAPFAEAQQLRAEICKQIADLRAAPGVSACPAPAVSAVTDFAGALAQFQGTSAAATAVPAVSSFMSALGGASPAAPTGCTAAPGAHQQHAYLWTPGILPTGNTALAGPPASTAIMPAAASSAAPPAAAGHNLAGGEATSTPTHAKPTGKAQGTCASVVLEFPASYVHSLLTHARPQAGVMQTRDVDSACAAANRHQ